MFSAALIKASVENPEDECLGVPLEGSEGRRASYRHIHLTYFRVQLIKTQILNSVHETFPLQGAG